MGFVYLYLITLLYPVTNLDIKLVIGFKFGIMKKSPGIWTLVKRLSLISTGCILSICLFIYLYLSSSYQLLIWIYIEFVFGLKVGLMD